MSLLAQRPRYSFAQYVELEQASSTKHEYFDGDIFAMARGTPEHAALSAAVTSSLLHQLAGGPCRVFSSDLRIRVVATGLAAYPDVTVVCGDLEKDPESQTTVVNPTAVVEVLSESTAAYDRGDKLAHYKQIASLQACVFVAHDHRRIEVHSRGNGSWGTTISRDGDVAMVESLGCRLDVNELYVLAGL